MTPSRDAAGSARRVRALPAFTAMTTRIRGWIPADVPLQACGRHLRHVFAVCEARLTRFRPDSELNRVGVSGGGRASAPLFRGLTTASRAWGRTEGLFDPRVRRDLEALGYGAGLRFGRRPPRTAVRAAPGPRLTSRTRWLQVRWASGAAIGAGGLRPHALILDPHTPLDLGGIGKGLALRYAVRVLRRHLAGAADAAPPSPRRTFGMCGSYRLNRPGFLIDAGGDIWAEGAGPDGRGWPVAVAGPQPERAVAVLRVASRAVCTSSRARRAWLAGGRLVHHLIDPRTGRPADEDLFSVTVIGRDPAWAEVWSKALFIAGAAGGARLAERRGLAALLLRPDGSVEVTASARRYLDQGVGC